MLILGNMMRLCHMRFALFEEIIVFMQDIP